MLTVVHDDDQSNDDSGRSLLDEIVRDGARQMLAAALQAEVAAVYFVAETKGSLSTLQLKGAEEAKIACARKFFASLNAKNGHDVTYNVVTDYTELMQLVTA